MASTTHLAGEMLNVAAGINTLHVPYKGSTPAITDMMGERVDFAFFGISGSMQQAKAGQIRMLGISTLKRSPNFPEIPAVAETVPGFELNSWYGMMAPAGTSKAIVNRLQQEVAAAVKKPDVTEWMKQNGLDPVGSTPEEHAAHIRAELAKYAKAVKDAQGLDDQLTWPPALRRIADFASRIATGSPFQRGSKAEGALVRRRLHRQHARGQHVAGGGERLRARAAGRGEAAGRYAGL